MVVCPACRDCLAQEDSSLKCGRCSRVFHKNGYGFFELLCDSAAYGQDSVKHEYAAEQNQTGARLWHDFFKPLLQTEPFNRVLDVGCGIGKMVSLAREETCEAYGVDVPALSAAWHKAGNCPDHFFCSDASQLPFPDEYFDVVWSLGVIEHIGTVLGHCTLAPDYREARQRYADEILRVTKRGGRIIIAGPNKNFPVDIQHGPSDALTRNTLSKRIRNRIFERTGINIHLPFGEYHLTSYSEMKKLFCKQGGVKRFEPLPLKNYFAFGRFQSGVLQKISTIAQVYANNFPAGLRSSFLNPYVLVLMEKQD